MERKTCQLTELKLDDKLGTVTALFAKFNEVDKQGDLTLPGAFGEQRIIISAYGHGSWSGALPVGKGRIFESDIGGIMQGEFNLKTVAGREAYETIKFTGDLQEWSYSLPEIDYEMREQDGQRVRVLKRIKVNEVSPVLLGAGNDTQTLEIKSGKTLVDQLEAVAGDAQKAVERLMELKDLRAADGRKPGVETLKRAAVVKESLEKLSIMIGGLEVGAGDPPKEEDYSMLAEAIRFTLHTTAGR